MAKKKEEQKPEEINEKITKKSEKLNIEKTSKEKNKEEKRKQDKKIKSEIEDKKFRIPESKSIQNKVIDNIKNFISKIIEMQEKVKKDEQEEKELKKTEENEKKEALQTPKYLLEYYDLPFRYNETVVKILAQTPKRLFVYWDVADKDKRTYLNAFGENFFNDTYPVLLLHNENKNYTSEIAINDFANSWYLDISDSRDKYTIQLGRKFKSYIKPQINYEIENTNIAFSNDYLMIAMSNKLEVPNDHILFEEFKPYVIYRNVKTHTEEIRNIETCIYPNQLKALYQKLYNNGITWEENGRFDMLNPSSMGTSSSIANKESL